MNLKPSCTGLAKGTPPEPCTVVIFGASGDLARNTLLPSLYALRCQKLLPDSCAIVGFAWKEWDDDTFREAIRQRIKAKKPQTFREDVWQEFARRLRYVRGDFTAPASDAYAALHNAIRDIQARWTIPDNVLLHLSTPPRFYGEIVEKSATAGVLMSEQGWRRAIIEKPFGHDRESAEALDKELLGLIDEAQLYRVDHFLGKETVQNMLAFRFGNPGIEPIWNHHFIDHVQITAAEDEGIGTRGRFYEKIGVVRDMVQNHLFQLLCVTAMEPPVAYDATSLRNETFKVLRSVRPVKARDDCVLGQYGSGWDESREIRPYRHEKNVAETSTTPTFAALKLILNNWRWSGVPFYIRTGKRMARKLTEINVVFKPTPHVMFPLEDREYLHNNVLAFRLQPEEAIIHTFLAKQPGADMCLRPVTMNFQYDTTFGVDELPSAYQWLLLDAMHGNQTLFPRSDWIYQAWSIVDPIIRDWESKPSHDLPNYRAGRWGPKAADALLERAGHVWRAV